MLTKNRIWKTLLAVVLIATLGFSSLSAAQAQGGPPPMFGDAADAPSDAGGPGEAHIARARFVYVNIGILFDASGKPLGKAALPQITLNLFPNVSYTGIVTRAWQDRWGSYWTGRLKGVPSSYFFLTVVDGVFMAHVGSTRGIYEVIYTPDGLYRAVQVDQSKFIDHAPGATFEVGGSVIPEGSLGETADSAARIDIMVAYTDDARAAAGGTAAMKALILTGLNETNTSYANAGITTRLRLVHVEEYSYVETGNLGTDLNRITNTTDAHFTTIHSLRNTYAADMVGLIVETAASGCGLANAIMASASNAFQVTKRSCVTPNYTFGHEFGHLQGARHDTYVDPTNTPYAYGHGYVHPYTTTASKRWRTIMAYNDRCTAWGYNCTRLLYFSNPTKTYTSDPMGTVGSSENYKVLNNTDYTVANFRTQIITDNFNSSFNGSSAGWSSVYGPWGIGSAAYYQSGGAANYCASTKHSGKYGDLTFEARMKRTGSYNGSSNRLVIRGNSASLSANKTWQPSYFFQYSNDGDFSVYELSSGGVYTTLKPWTIHAAIVVGGWNTLKVVAVGSSLKFYINGTLVWSGSDSSFKVGEVGVGMCRDSSSTGNLLQVDWAKLSNTPTADLNPFEEVVPGVEVPGGDDTHSP